MIARSSFPGYRNWLLRPLLTEDVLVSAAVSEDMDDILEIADGIEKDIITFGPYYDYFLLNYYGFLKPDIEILLIEQERELREQRLQGCYVEIPGLPGGDPWLHSGTPKIKIGDPAKFPRYLRNELFCAAVGTGGGMSFADAPLTMRVRPHTRTIRERDLIEIDAMSKAIADSLLSETERIQVSRVDLAVDFQIEGFEIPSARDVVTYASRRSREKDKRTGLDVLTLGRSSKRLQAQLYDKSAKIRATNQDYMWDVYRREGSFREDLKVFRMEFRFERELLRELVLPS